jgi:hypothetical protein
MENSSSANQSINDSFLDKEKDQGYFNLEIREYKEVLEDSSLVFLNLK